MKLFNAINCCGWLTSKHFIMFDFDYIVAYVVKQLDDYAGKKNVTLAGNATATWATPTGSSWQATVDSVTAMIKKPNSSKSTCKWGSSVNGNLNVDGLNDIKSHASTMME